MNAAKTAAAEAQQRLEAAQKTADTASAAYADAINKQSKAAQAVEDAQQAWQDSIDDTLNNKLVAAQADLADR